MMKTTTGVQTIYIAVLVVAAAMLVVAPAAEGRALLNLGKLIDHFLDCPPPPVVEEAPAPEPAYSVPYSYSPPDGEAPAPYGNVPDAPEYQSPPGPPADDSPPASPISEPAPEYQTPPAGGY